MGLSSLIPLSTCLLLGSVSASNSWIRTTAAPGDTTLQVAIGLKHSPAALQALENIFWAVSDPSSSQWSHFMSRDEADDLVRPDSKHVSIVINWLESGGSSNITVAPGGDWVYALATVKQASALFGVT